MECSLVEISFFAQAKPVQDRCDPRGFTLETSEVFQSTLETSEEFQSTLETSELVLKQWHNYLYT